MVPSERSWRTKLAGALTLALFCVSVAVAADKNPAKSAEKPKVKATAEKTTDQPAEKSKDKLTEKSKDKITEKSKDKLAEKPKEKVADKPKEKPAPVMKVEAIDLKKVDPVSCHQVVLQLWPSLMGTNGGSAATSTPTPATTAPPAAKVPGKPAEKMVAKEKPPEKTLTGHVGGTAGLPTLSIAIDTVSHTLFVRSTEQGVAVVVKLVADLEAHPSLAKHALNHPHAKILRLTGVEPESVIQVLTGLELQKSVHVLSKSSALLLTHPDSAEAKDVLNVVSRMEATKEPAKEPGKPK